MVSNVCFEQQRGPSGPGSKSENSHESKKKNTRSNNDNAACKDFRICDIIDFSFNKLKG